MVDEKGRLFGKLNIIDFLVIILLIAALALVGYKLLGKGGDASGGGTQLTYTVVVRGVDPATYDSVKQYVSAEGGDRLMANGELVSAYVTDVQSTPHTSNAKVTANENGEKVEIMLDANTVDLTFTIKANVSNTTTNEVGTQEVRIGKTHIVKTVHFEFAAGTIIDCRSEALAEG
ncbi:MAG: DUF4330 domain-containing protein [Clostridia bacterium]|nr:DUF4330 domain-containing protein [Clostridia bacterium]